MRSKKILVPKCVEVGDLLSLVGHEDLKHISRMVEADKWVPKLKATNVFGLLLYSLLDSERMSFRVMADNYNSATFKVLLSRGLGDKDELLTDFTAHSSLSDRLKTIKVDFFKQVYEKVYRDVAKLYGDKGLKRYNIKRYDSTMIAVFSHLLEGMKVGNTSRKKNQVKMTTELTDDFEVRMRFFSDQDHLGEEVALKEMIQSQSHSPEDIIVFDRGLKSRKTLCEFKAQKTHFVTRLNDTNRYKFIRSHSDMTLPETAQDKDSRLSYCQDSIVYLYADGNKIVKEEFRLIEVLDIKKGKKLFFLTNILDLPAQMIAEVYRHRWEIEVFFRFLKQEMNLKHFICNEVNAIQVMMYMTLIATMLILVYKKKNEIGSYKIAKKRFLKDLEATIILDLIQTEKGLNFYKQCLKIQVEEQLISQNKKKRSVNTS